MSTQDIGHPHRCCEGHRWQHTGPTAVTCEIPLAESGDLTLVSAGDCPLCSGREDLLTRDLHSHYCNTCSGDWDHEGRCLEGLAASCPWCFPVPGAAPVPGARRGPHFHFCPECAQNWQHDASCAAPLRAALPDCSGCRGLSADPAAGERVAKSMAAFSAPRLHVPRIDVARSVHGFVRSAVVMASVGAGVALTIPILFQVSSTLWTLAPDSVPPDGNLGAVATPPEPAGRSIWPSEPTGPRLVQEAPSAARGRLLHRNGERRGEPESSSARKVPPKEPDVRPDRAAPATGLRTAGVEETRAPSSPLPSPSPRERVAETSSQAKDAMVAQRERGPSTSSANAPSSSPEVLPRGGAALDALPQDPLQLARAPQPRHDLPTWSEASPRWDRASLSVLLHAVVDIRPVTLGGSGLDRPPAASGREASEFAPQPIRGFVIDEFGHIITSHRRLGGATSFEVMPFNGRLLRATVVARDPLNGIAVLRLERRGLPLIAFGDSGALVVGDRVLTIGGESGADRTLTAATVLATGAGTGGNLAVDLTPTPERVGGPLLNHLGQAVGIVIDGASPAGSQRKLTFAVPVDRVKSLLRNLSLRPTAELMNMPEAR